MSIQTRPLTAGRAAGTQAVERLAVNWWRAVVVGIAVGSTALATAAASPPHPIVAVSLAVLLVVLAPTADSLSRRVAINLTLALCWAPLLAWMPHGLAPGGRAAVGLAVALGAAAAAVSCRGASPWSRLLPSTQPRDISLLFAGLTAAWVAGPLHAARTPEQALAMLNAGWDHASHFSMYLEQRATGTAPPFMPPAADSSGAYFEHYPQWFHSLLAMLAEVAYGPVAGAVPEELVRYATLQWVVFVIVAVLTTAAVVQALPSRVGLPTHVAAVLCSWSLVLAVPGAINLLQGHLSFLVSAVAPALIALLVTRRLAVPSLPAAAAICGLIVVSAAWLLVVPLALVAAAGPLYRLGRSPRPRVRAAVGGMLAVALSISALLAWVSIGSPVDEHITADGPVVATALPWVVGIPTAVLLLGLVAVRRNRLNTTHDLVVLLALAATGLAQFVGLGVYQVVTAGQLTYYFWKMSLAVQVVVLLVAIPVLAHEALRLRKAQKHTGDASRRRLFSLAAVTVLVPALGLGVGLRTSALPSVVWLTGFSDALAQRSRATGPAEDLLRWSRSVPPSEAVNVTVLATRPGDLSPAYTDQWFHSLTRTRTVRAGTYDVPLFVLGITPSPEQRAVDIARQVTSTDSGQLWVTDPALAARLQALLSADAAARVRLAP